MLSSIQIILVEPTHPGNIGAAARAMKTMGLTQLVLVSPHEFPHQEATARAAGADDLLQQAKVFSTLKEALCEAHWVFGASVRERTLSRQLYSARECADIIAQQSNDSSQKIAIVFGRERSGLTNEELALCHDQVFIPANPDYSSLNLAAAVQVMTYELRMAFLMHQLPTKNNSLKKIDEPATAEQVAGFYAHLQKVLTDIDFLHVKQPKRLMERLYLLFNRTKMSVTELNILRGILTAMQKKMSEANVSER